MLRYLRRGLVALFALLRLGGSNLEHPLVKGRRDAVNVHRLRQRDLAEYAPLVEFTEMNGSAHALMPVAGFALHNQRVREHGNPEFFGVESWQRQLKLKFFFVFGKLHTGNEEYVLLGPQPVAEVIAGSASALL